MTLTVAATAPLVSVVVPAHQAAWSIERTLASISAQTYPSLEVLVVDDGSTDATCELVAAHALRDPRVRLIRQGNAGVAAARNRGAREARGLYVAPIDSDDLWAPDNLARQVAALEAAGPEAGFAFALSACIDEQDRPLPGPRRPAAPRIDFRGLLLRNAVGNGSAAVFRRARLLDVGGWDESLRARGGQGAEDWKLTLSLAARGKTVLVPEPLVRYRINREGMSHDFGPMGRGLRLAVEDARCLGPRQPPWIYWHARSLAMLWLLKRTLNAGRLGQAAGFAAWAYLANPFWFALPEARALPLELARAALSGKAWRKLAGAPRAHRVAAVATGEEDAEPSTPVTRLSARRAAAQS